MEDDMTHPVVWFEVLGKDGKKLQHFYAEMFGWQIKVDNPMGYGMVDTKAKSGIPGGIGSVFEGTRSWVTFYVETKDLAASLQVAERLGGKVVMPPKKIPNGPALAIFEDPEGHVVGLVEAEGT